MSVFTTGACQGYSCRFVAERSVLGREAAEDATETALPALILKQGQQQFTPPEVGPEGGREVEFCVSQLPKEKVADAGFPARPDQEIRVREIMSVEKLVDERFVDLLDLDLSILDFPDDVSDCIDHFSPTAVAEGDRQVELVEVSRFLLRGPDPLQSGAWKRFGPSDGSKSHTLLYELVPFGRQVMFEQPHQRIDLLGRPIPVLLGERKNRQSLYPELQAKRDHFPDGLDPFPVTGDAREAPRFGPATVPVHDYRHMLWKEVGIKFGSEICL